MIDNTLVRYLRGFVLKSFSKKTLAGVYTLRGTCAADMAFLPLPFQGRQGKRKAGNVAYNLGLL
ncbi:MAG: hypothetical protein HY392_01205 [Candidatus Diapherotrites archaeon]|nr:hypothetical protein [Candidatus Diapherotrites archaeon]